MTSLLNKTTIGPGGNSASFKNQKLKFPDDLAAYLKSFSLNGYEVECGRGLNVSAKSYEVLPQIAADNDIYLSLHAPYYVSLSSESEETRNNSVKWLVDTAKSASRLNISKVVVHSGSCAKIPRDIAMTYAAETLKRTQDIIEKSKIDVCLCPETMGKINQLGTLEEVLELCKISESFLPCIDFGHLNARSQGAIKTKEDYEQVFNLTEQTLGAERAKRLHIHFSKIEYTVGGEKKHLTFDDTVYGPNFEPMIDIIKERGYFASIICESSGTQAEDASVMFQHFSK